MHISFAGIVSKDPANRDDLFAICEPSLRAEPCLRLGGAGWHPEESGYPDDESDATSVGKDMCNAVSDEVRVVGGGDLLDQE